MKIFKRILLVLTILALAGFVAFSLRSGIGQFTNVGDISGVSIETTRETPILADFEPSDENVRPIGRTVYQDGVRWASMSGSGIEFDCLASYLDITLICENPQNLTYNHRPRIAVFADDNVVFDECLSQEETVAHVDLSGYDESTVIKVIKLSESMHSAFGIGNISVYGRKDIKPTEEKQLRIEFIGDSITAGYGIDEENRYASFSTQTENFAETYAYLTAKELDAQYSAVAFSGYGVLSGSGSYFNPDSVIFNVYDKAITNKSFETESDENQTTVEEYSEYSEDQTTTSTSTDETTTSDLTDESTSPDLTDESNSLEIWDNRKFETDIVVINLGTNDAVYCSNDERREQFKEKYIELLSLVRQKNPNAYILCILGDMNNSLFGKIQEAVKEYSEETGDNDVSSQSIAFDMEKNGAVISGHPSKSANESAAKELVQIIKDIIAGRNDVSGALESETEQLSENSDETDISSSSGESETETAYSTDEE